MNLFLQCGDKVLLEEFSKQAKLTSPQSADVMFIDWLPDMSQSFLDKYKTLKKKQTFIIFDRFLSIEVNEANDFRRKGYILMEPVLNFRRKYFHYIPFWTKIKGLDDIKLNEELNVRPYDLVYKGNLQGKKSSFNQYYIEYAKSYPKTVFYENQKSISQLESESYSNHGIVKKDNISYTDAKTTLIIGSPLDYEIGYLDYHIFEALDNNCIPLIVNEHKYFSLLSPYRIDNPISDINYITNSYNGTYIGYIRDIYLYIEKYYPEMIVENVVKQILDYVR
jgi:hypothetical protein